MALLNLQLQTNDTQTFVGSDKRTTAGLLQRLFKSMAMGSRLFNVSMSAGVTPVAASAYLAIDDASVNGTVGGTINGVSITVAAASDTGYVVAQNLATAINASSDALVVGLVTAVASNPTGDDGRVTITAATKYGKAGNGFTLAASGTGVTASAARLAGGTDGTVTSFTY